MNGTERTGSTRTGSTLTGRPLRETLIGRTRQLADIAAGLPTPGTAPQGAQRQPRDLDPENHDLAADVSASIDTINKVAETYGVLLDKLSAYEVEVRDLKRQLAEEERTTGHALRAAARAEETAREAQSRVGLAEAETERSAETVRTLERQLAALRAQTAKLMDAVDQLFPDLDEDALGAARGLRVVR